MRAEEKIRVVLADDDVCYNAEICKGLKKESNIEVVGLASDGEEALALIEKLKPDVLILDMLMPKKDGLWVLEEIKRRNLTNINCIVVSALDNDNVVRKASYLGAVYYIVKPVQADILARRIRQVYETFQEEAEKNSLQKNAILSQPYLETKEEKNIECRISSVLSKMGISASIKGYHYLRSAIIMAVDNESTLIGITKGMYPDIARQYKTTASKVERAIRHAIESSWKKSGQAVYEEIVGYPCNNKPTNGQFIATITEYFRLNFKTQSERTA